MKNNKDTMKNKSFYNFRHNAINLTFKNGNEISTVWGVGTYSGNYNNGNFDDFLQSNNVEIKIKECDGKALNLLKTKYNLKEEDCNILAYINIDQWLDILNILNN
jgi:hypothetical protein